MILARVLVSEDRFDSEILRSCKPVVVELFSNDSIKCLLYSVPIRDLFNASQMGYRKIKIEDGFLLKKYKINKLPCLLFFKNGKLLDKIEGY